MYWLHILFDELQMILYVFHKEWLGNSEWINHTTTKFKQDENEHKMILPTILLWKC